MPDYVAYYRVSTDRQGESRLGLEAQRQAVAQFIGGASLLAEFQEVESGRNHRNRPQLAAAIELCKKGHARLVIAKLDRLARNVHFVSGLMESKVDFVAVDNPHATKFSIHIIAAVAELEAAQISERTRAALQQAKRELAERGQRVSVRGRVYTRLGNSPGVDTSRARAKRHPVKPLPHVIELMRDLRAQGRTYRAIADHLNDQLGLRTPRGARWHNETIRDLLARHSKEEVHA
jgi:DNA invertase Pin-like site-specific DNA recombinase